VRGSLPPRPEGDDAETLFMQWVWDKLAKELVFNNSPTVKFNKTTKGITADSAAESPATSMREISICIDGNSDYFAMVAMSRPYRYDETTGEKIYLEET
jgi:hypothetical protein